MAWSKPGYKQPGNWKTTRARILKRDPYCPCGEPSTEVDHVVRVGQGGTHDDANLIGLCTRCHTRKTQAEAQASRRTRKRPQEAHPNGR